MKRLPFILPLLFLVPALSWAGDKDDFGIWMGVGAQKALPHNLSVGVDADLRTRDTSKKVDRIGIGVDLGYKLNKYVKFGVAYDFLESYKDEKATIKYKKDSDTIKNVKVTPSYWRPRHRFSLEVSPSVKLWQLLRVSVRERYQYTHQKEQTLTRYTYEYKATANGLDEEGNPIEKEEWKIDGEPDQKKKSQKDMHVLRSRLKIEIDKKKLAWSPFVSVETQNYFKKIELNDGGCSALRNVRTMAGTEYKINKHNSVGMAYVFTRYKEDKERMHAISVEYNFKF